MTIVPMKVDDIAHFMGPRIHQHDVPADGHISVIARRGGQVTAKIRGNGVRLSSEIAGELPAGLQACLLITRQTILRSEPFRCVFLVLLVPLVGSLPVMIVELRTVLRAETAGEEKYEGNTQIACFHGKASWNVRSGAPTVPCQAYDTCP
jgi:hypothetical protein